MNKNKARTRHGNNGVTALYFERYAGMNMKKSLKLLIISLFMMSSGFVMAAGSDVPDPLALEQERQMKQDSESQAQAICDSILGKGRSSVLVNVELGLESTRKGGSALEQKMDKKGGGSGDESFILPWVPAPKSVTKEEMPKDANFQTQAAQQTSLDVKTVLKRFDITVVYDDTIPEERVTLVKDTLESAFDRYKNILKVFFRATSYVKDNFNGREVVTKNLWDSLNLKNFFLLFLLMLAFMLLRFFFGPLADFMKSYIDGMKEQSKSKVEMDNKSETENESEANNEDEGLGGEGALTAEEQAILDAQAEEELMKKFEPFKYVNDENLKQLAYLLHHEEPWVVAMVMSYLSADHAFKVMEALPASLQAKVALETAMYRQTSHEQVQAIDEDIKQKIDFVVGGLEKLVNILENSDRSSRDNILETLKNEKPAIYERVRENILLFEDIAQFPKVAMQAVVRELKTEALGRALRGAAPELQQKFYENMSQGAVTLLKEEMEYGRPVTEEQIEEERRKIVDMIKLMEKDGKISFRQKGKVAALSGDEMSSGRSGFSGVAGPVDVDGALNAYNAGLAASETGQADEALQQFELSVQLNPGMAASQQALANAYYAMGRYPEALACFDTALQLEPNEELRAWVDEFRASVSANAA